MSSLTSHPVAAAPHLAHHRLSHSSHAYVPHHRGSGHAHHGSSHHHTGPIKYKLGIAILSWIQIIGGMLALNFEAISSVLYVTNASTNETLHGTEFAGIYVAVFAQVTGGLGLLSIKKHGVTAFFRGCLHVAHLVLTTFLAVQAFAMCCASGAMLVFLVAGWDTILAFVNRVSKAEGLNLSVGTTTTVVPTTVLPPLIAAEIEQDRHIIVGLRSTLFALYFVHFASAVISSCFACCNYCRCWNTDAGKVDHISRESTVTTLGIPERHELIATVEAVHKEVMTAPSGEHNPRKGHQEDPLKKKHRHGSHSKKQDSAKYH